MGNSQKLSIQIIGNLNAACACVGDVNGLDGKVAYRLGRLGSFTDSIIRQANRTHQNILKEHHKKIEKMNEEQKKAEAEKVAVKIQELNEMEEEVNVPKFKYSEFISATDTRVGDRDIKAGQPLVPIKFFSLMGEFVEDDQGVVKGMFEKKEKATVKKAAGK